MNNKKEHNLNKKTKGKRYSKQKRVLKIPLIVIIAIIIASVLGIIQFGKESINTIQQNGKLNFSNSGSTEQTAEEIGQVGYVSQSVVTQIKTGTGPFDSNNNPGNDKDEDNNIVRSFDQITYTIENTTKLKDESTGLSYKGGALQIKAELPEELAGYAKWDLNSMAWAEDTTLSENGLIFTAKYPLSKWVVTVPGKQTISYVVQVLGAKNNTEITPTFTTSLVGNEESENCIVTASVTYVSAAPKLNIQIRKVAESSLNYKGYFEPSTGDEVSSKTSTSINGRMQGYGITVQLYNTTEDKALKGIEIPKGDITFDVSLAEFLGTTDVTNQTNYKPVLWDYNNNISSNYGKGGRRFDWNGYMNSTRATLIAPYNSMEEAALDDARKQRECCYNGGDWTIVQDSSNKNLYHVTINGYVFEPNMIFPTQDGARNSTTAVDYGKNIGCFSSGFMQVIAQTPETVSSTEDLYLKATVSNLKFTSLSDEIKTEDQNSDDNVSNKNITLYPPGALQKAQWFNNESVQVPSTGGNLALSSNYKDGDGYTSKKSEFYLESLIDYSSGDTVYKRYNILQKFDDKGIEPLEDANTTSSRYRATRSTIAEIGNVKVLYAAKPNKQGWTNDTEMQNTREEKLIYFTAYADLKQQGYKCVGILYEITNSKIYSGTQVWNDLKMKVKDTAEIGKVYATTNDFRAWSTNEQFTWENQTYTYNNNTLQYTNLNYPTPTRYIYNDDSNTDPKMYVKSAYDEGGELVTGTHKGGFHAGNSLLIVGADLKVNREINDKVNNNPKVNYDLGKSELEAEFKITPSLSNNKLEAGSISGVKVKITDTLPKGLTYKQGSSNIDEPTVTENADGTTTLVWYIDNCSVNNEIEPIIYKAQIDETTKNGVQYLTTTQIEEVLQSGQTSDIGTSPLTARKSTNTIQIVNLATYNLYKTTNTPLIEVNGTGKFKVTAVNITDNDVTDFQLLDILPYNEDGRGTSYDGTYQVKKITLKQIDSNTGDTLPITNLNLYKTSDDSTKEASCKDENFAEGASWTQVTSGQAINEEIVGYAVKGTLSRHAKLEIEIEIETDGNKPGDLYENQAQAQTNIDTDPMISPIVGIEVINRTIEGTIWEDTNEDGLITENEAKLKDITVELIKEDGTSAKDINGDDIAPIKTNVDGYYKFDKVAKGNYKVKVTVPSQYNVTDKDVGNDETLNSKINSNGQTDLITELNTTEHSNVRNQNAGLVLKDTKVTVKHLIEGTENHVPLKTGGEATDEIKNGKVGDYYETEPVEPADQYEVVSATPADSSGNMTVDEITVTYYYRLKKYPYTVNYYDKDTNDKIATTKNGTETTYGTEIQVNDEKINIAKYDFDSSNVNGDTTATKLTIGTNPAENVINLYYTKKVGHIIVKYVDQNTGEEIPGEGGASLRETDSKKVDESYTTVQKTIEGYTFVESTNNTTGTYTVESVTTPIEVIYYYKKNTKVTVNHIDQKTREKIPEANGDDSTVTQNGLVGDSYTSTSKNFENYVLVERPTSETVTMTEDEIVLNYYYVYSNANVIEKHVDDYTGEILYNEEHTGNEGDNYNIPSKTFEGYELVETKLPTNAQGPYTKETITVTYYYRYPTKVTAKYIDKYTGKEIKNDDGTPSKEEKPGYAGQDYTTEPKNFEGYDLITEELPTNANGKMTKDEIEVRYYYLQQSAGVTENHYDIKTGKKLVDEKKYPGHVGDDFETASKIIDGYELVKVEKNGTEVKDKTNIKGKMEKDEIKADYYYVKKTKVTVKYVDKLTGKEIEPPIVIPGVEDDKYETEPKDIPEYELIKEEIPKNKDGKMTNDEIEVIYYYKKKAIVEVKYVEEKTEKEIVDKETINGYIEDPYKSEKKDIKYYEFVKATENTEGNMTDEKIEVKYYYHKKTFNLKAEKEIATIIFNGSEKKVNSDIAKREIKNKNIKNTTLQVKYRIKVTNDGELKGSATVKERIPSGFEMKKAENKDWKISGKTATIKIKNIKPGETKEYEVLLTWKNSSENFGTKQNTVELVDIENEAGFRETNKEDNTDKADMIISLATGEKTIRNIIIISVVALGLVAIVIRKNRRA